MNGLGSLQAQSLPLRGDRTPPALLFRGVLAFNSVVVKQQRPDIAVNHHGFLIQICL
ncbi:hypothetical protein BBCT_1244 [Bifidobacterium catenulatum DSM 16992 = JCM 1194 = LMG 11043]|uniref:Uncharacterized protein n=1 Tax=Bifidobacterium catenulatum DSM 16992 = JCM 1194 = LMG 11043 TaxID=566552 RepID=A0ABM7EW86_9BIFI|nr:hypothetical protein BBCT_1244 [Bifidobacterium catenulatum DSM 16992 = JCM 1194 = LMG 11043]